MNLLSLDEHRMLFHGLQRIPRDEQVSDYPQRSVLEKYGIDPRLLVKWYANRPKNCPSCEGSDAWTIGGEDDILYSCTSCFTDIYVEKRTAEPDPVYNMENTTMHDKHHATLGQENTDESREVNEYLDLFFLIDSVATSFLESPFGRNCVPSFDKSEELVTKIPWKEYPDVTNAFCILCTLENVNPLSWNLDPTKMWCCYFTVVQRVTGLTFDHLRRILHFTRLYGNPSLAMSTERPYLVKSTTSANTALPLLQWLYLEQSCRNSISIHDMHMLRQFSSEETDRSEISDKISYARRTESTNIERVAMMLRFLELEEWIPMLENPVCIQMLNDIFYFFEFPERFLDPVMPINKQQECNPLNFATIEWERASRGINISTEQKVCCFLLFFFQRIQRFPSVVREVNFYEKISLWIKEWYTRAGLVRKGWSKTELPLGIFPEPHLNLLIEILALTSCTTASRLVHFTFLVVTSVHSLFGPKYTEEFLYKTKKYFMAVRPPPQREYGDIGSPLSVLSDLFKNPKLLTAFEKELYRNKKSMTKEAARYMKIFDDELLGNALFHLNCIKDKRSRKKVEIDENNSFLRSGLQTHNIQTLVTLFFQTDSYATQLPEARREIFESNSTLIKQVFLCAREIVFTHHYSLEVTGLKDADASPVTFLPLPTNFITTEAYLRKIKPASAECSCGHMICFRSIHPDTSFVISWFVYERQWKILRARGAADYTTRAPPKLSILREKSATPTCYTMCPTCKNTYFHLSGDKDYAVDTFTKYIFDNEFEVLASSIGSYNGNTMQYSLGGQLTDAHSFPMFDVMDVERWDRQGIHLTLHPRLQQMYYPPLPEVLYALTVTDVLTARQKIVEWLLLSLFQGDKLSNRNTRQLRGCISSESLASSSLHKEHEKDVQRMNLHGNLLSRSHRPVTPYVVINQLVDGRVMKKSDVVDTNHVLSRLLCSSKVMPEWRAFFETLSKRHPETLME